MESLFERGALHILVLRLLKTDILVGAKTFDSDIIIIHENVQKNIGKIKIL